MDYLATLDPPKILYVFIGFNGLATLTNVYLFLRQLRVNYLNQARPVLSEAVYPSYNFNRAREYEKDILIFSIVIQTIYYIADTVLQLNFFHLKMWTLAESTMLTIGGWHGDLVFQTGVYHILDSYFLLMFHFPMNIFHAFVIEKKHGLNRMTFNSLMMKIFVHGIPKILIHALILMCLCYLWNIFGPTLAVYMLLSFILIAVYNSFLSIYLESFCYLTKRLPKSTLKVKLENMMAKAGFSPQRLYLQFGRPESAFNGVRVLSLLCFKMVVLSTAFIGPELWQESSVHDTAGLTVSVTPKSALISRKSKVGLKKNVIFDIDELEEIKDQRARSPEDSSSNWSISTVDKKEIRPPFIEARPQASLEQQEAQLSFAMDHTTKNKMTFHDEVRSQLTIDEILAGVAHELGHAVLNHVIKLLPLEVVLVALDLDQLVIMSRSPNMRAAYGFQDYLPFPVGWSIVNTTVMPLKMTVRTLRNLYAQKFEFDADRFGAKMVGYDTMKKFVHRLAAHTRFFPLTDKCYASYFFTQPSTLERYMALTIAQ